jgi:hypothetical protein
VLKQLICCGKDPDEFQLDPKDTSVTMEPTPEGMAWSIIA